MRAAETVACLADVDIDVVCLVAVPLPVNAYEVIEIVALEFAEV